VLFDGSVTDEQGFVGIGGSSEDLTDRLREDYQPEWNLATGVQSAVKALASVDSRSIPPEDIEAAVLDRTRSRRKFRRLSDDEVAGILDTTGGAREGNGGGDGSTATSGSAPEAPPGESFGDGSTPPAN
jgi:proteasome alpha subunit